MSKPNRRTLGMPVLTLMLCSITAWGRVDADPNSTYEITPAAGPWLICVTSYTADAMNHVDPLKLAHELVIELRQRYDLPAYVYNRGKEERDKQEEALKQRREQQIQMMKMMGMKEGDAPIRVKRVNVADQCAVLVGGYRDIEEARRALERIKKLDEPKSETSSFFIIGKGKQDKEKTGQVTKNPFLTAFVVRNPTVQQQTQQVDHEADFKFLQQLNSGEKFSLLDCKKPWTLVVKEFRGNYVMQPKSAPTGFLSKLLGEGNSDSLDAGARQAKELARVMRDKMQLEAYVLHTRRGSVITVGGYDSVNDPRLLQNQKTLSNLQFGPAIQFMAIPLPMEVPHP